MPQENEKVKPVSEMSFEEALQELESIASQMERGGLSLNKMTAMVNRSMELSKKCNQDLNSVEESLKVLDPSSSQGEAMASPLESMSSVASKGE